MSTNNYIFRKSNGQPFTVDHVSKVFKKASRAAGIRESIHAHSLRHSFGSYLAQNGVDIYSIQDLMGHSSIKMTERYAHLNNESRKKAMSKFDEEG